MIYVLIAVILFIADCVIKYKIEKTTKSDTIKEILNKRIMIRKYHNSGALLEVFSKRQKEVAMTSLAVASFISGIFTVTLVNKEKPMLKIGFALILGGAFSNTYDRLSKNYVVDYLSFKVNSKCKILKRFENIVFNISDFCIIIGSILLLLSQIKDAE